MRRSKRVVTLLLITVCLGGPAASVAGVDEFDIEVPADGSSGPAYVPGPEFKVGVGVVPAPSVLEVFTDVWAVTTSLGSLSVETESNDLALFAEYVRPLSRRTRVAVHFGYSSYDKTYTVRSTGEVLGKVTNRYYTLLLGVEQYYLLTGAFSLYGDFLLGVSQADASSDTDALGTDGGTLAGFQITPLGLRIGRDPALDLSVGFGYKGTFMASVNFAF